MDRSHHEDWCQGAHPRRQAPRWFLVWRSPYPPCLAYTPTSSPTTPSPPPAGETAKEMSSRSSLTLAATSVSPVCFLHVLGVMPSFYLSPWDRNFYNMTWRPEYNQFYLDTFKVLLNNYGPIYGVWWDGANAQPHMTHVYPPPPRGFASTTTGLSGMMNSRRPTLTYLFLSAVDFPGSWWRLWRWWPRHLRLRSR